MVELIGVHTDAHLNKGGVIDIEQVALRKLAAPGLI